MITSISPNRSSNTESDESNFRNSIRHDGGGSMVLVDKKEAGGAMVTLDKKESSENKKWNLEVLFQQLEKHFKKDMAYIDQRLWYGDDYLKGLCEITGIAPIVLTSIFIGKCRDRDLHPSVSAQHSFYKHFREVAESGEGTWSLENMEFGIEAIRGLVLALSLKPSKFKILKLASNILKDAGAKLLGDVLSIPFFPLQVLDLRSTGLAEEGARALCKGLQNNIYLRSLNLGSYDLLSKFSNMILNGLDKMNLVLHKPNSVLEKLELRRSSVGQESINSIIESLGSGMCKLEHLNLSYNDMGSDIFLAIIKSLFLSNDDMFYQDDDSLKMTSPMKVLDLSENPIGNVGLELVAEFLYSIGGMSDKLSKKMDVVLDAIIGNEDIDIDCAIIEETSEEAFDDFCNSENELQRNMIKKQNSGQVQRGSTKQFNPNSSGPLRRGSTKQFNPNSSGPLRRDPSQPYNPNSSGQLPRDPSQPFQLNSALQLPRGSAKLFQLNSALQLPRGSTKLFQLNSTLQLPRGSTKLFHLNSTLQLPRGSTKPFHLNSTLQLPRGSTKPFQLNSTLQLPPGSTKPSQLNSTPKKFGRFLTESLLDEISTTVENHRKSQMPGVPGKVGKMDNRMSKVGRFSKMDNRMSKVGRFSKMDNRMSKVGRFSKMDSRMSINEKVTTEIESDEGVKDTKLDAHQIKRLTRLWEGACRKAIPIVRLSNHTFAKELNNGAELELPWNIINQIEHTGNDEDETDVQPELSTQLQKLELSKYDSVLGLVNEVVGLVDDEYDNTLFAMPSRVTTFDALLDKRTTISENSRGLSPGDVTYMNTSNTDLLRGKNNSNHTGSVFYSDRKENFPSPATDDKNHTGSTNSLLFPRNSAADIDCNTEDHRRVTTSNKRSAEESSKFLARVSRAEHLGHNNMKIDNRKSNMLTDQKFYQDRISKYHGILANDTNHQDMYQRTFINLKILNLSDCGITHEAVHLMEHFSCITIEILLLNYNNFSHPDTKLPVTDYFKELSLIKCRLSEGAVINLAERFTKGDAKALNKLLLKSNRISPKALHALGLSCQYCPVLVTLDLSFCHIGDSNLRKSTFDEMKQSAELSSCQRKKGAVDNVNWDRNRLIDGTKGKEANTELDISENDPEKIVTGLEGLEISLRTIITEVDKTIKENLEELNLRSSKCSLQYIDLSNNSLSEENVTTLLNAVSHNDCIVRINLQMNGIPQKILNLFLPIFKINRNLDYVLKKQLYNGRIAQYLKNQEDCPLIMKEADLIEAKGENYLEEIREKREEIIYNEYMHGLELAKIDNQIKEIHERISDLETEKRTEEEEDILIKEIQKKEEDKLKKEYDDLVNEIKMVEEALQSSEELLNSLKIEKESTEGESGELKKEKKKKKDKLKMFMSISF